MLWSKAKGHSEGFFPGELTVMQALSRKDRIVFCFGDFVLRKDMRDLSVSWE